MDELYTVRLISAWLAALLLAVGVIGLLRLSRMPMAVLVASFLGIPVLAFVTDAVWPRPPGSPDVAYLALPLVGIALAALLASVASGLPRRRNRSFASLHRRTVVLFVIWPCMVLAISDFVFVFEPVFAIANIGANAAWFIVWIPRATRRFTYENSYVVAAPRERVFAFVTEPANWPLYRPDIESVEVRPPGSISVGSALITRRRAEYPGLRGPRMTLPDTFETAEVVTQFVANEQTASRRTDGPDASASLTMTSIDGGTLVTSHTTTLLAYRYAVLGSMLSLIRNRPKVLGQLRAQQARLRALLEKPTAEA